MNDTSAMATPVDEARLVASAAEPGTMRTFYWCVRRELWDNRAIWMAPAITAWAVFSMFLLIMVVMAKPGRVPALPYEIAPSFVLLAMFFVWVFYTLDTLHAERRDRSILFWKSLPVSDTTTILSKAAIPMVVLPAVTFAVVASLTFALWLAYKTIGLVVGVPLDAPMPLPLLRTWGVLLYGIVAMTLWHAPIYAWNLLVSGWARRAPFVWAALPLAALAKLEQVALGTRHLSDLLFAPAEAFLSRSRPFLMIDPADSIAPWKFLANPSLWIGLVAAALLLYAAARLRRERSPL